MRRLHIIMLAALVVSAVIFIVSESVNAIGGDNTIPEIRCDEGPLKISVQDRGDDLLQGVTAWDAKDGDITDNLVVQQVERSEEDGIVRITYAVSDNDNNVATRSRTIIYTDYNSPQFMLTQELRYTGGSTVKIRDRLMAYDVIDGVISDRIKLIANNISTYYEGSYPITVEVTNSLGDTSSLELEIEVRNYADGEPRISLTQYIVYLDDGEKFDPESLIAEVTGADKDQVSVKISDGGLKKGVNKVVYSCTGDSGVTGKTVLYVVVG